MCVRHVRESKSRGPSPLMALDQYCCSRSFLQRQALLAYTQLAPVSLSCRTKLLWFACCAVVIERESLLILAPSGLRPPILQCVVV